MKNILLCIVIIPICHLLMAQDTKEWVTVNINNIGSFKISPKLEVAEGIGKVMLSGAFKYLDIKENQRVVAYSKGMSKGKVEKYGSIVFETEYGQNGDFSKLDEQPIDKLDLADVDALIKENAKNYLLSINDKVPAHIIKWFPVEMKKINNMWCIYASYTRTSGVGNLFEQIYFFYNYNCTHSFTLSYRVSDETYWKADFSKILNSLKIRKR